MEIQKDERTKKESPNVAGMRELLGVLPNEELVGLLKTVTSSLVPFGGIVDSNGRTIDARTHAINSILMYSDAISLMNKQRMKKNYLAMYLNRKGIKMTMPATKHTLSKDILKLWGQEMPEYLNLIDDEDEEKKTNINRQKSNRAAIKSESKPNIENLNFNQSQMPAESAPHPHNSASTRASSVNDMSNSVVPVQCEMEESMEFESTMSLRQREAQLGQELGKQFSAWFYERLNTLTDFTSSHFWPECNFRLELIFAAQADKTVIDETMSGEVCCAKLKDLVSVKQLFFNINGIGSTGVRGCLNPHGLAQVMVCGSIHQRGNGNGVGLFEQMFGLMKDPTDGNNFKIKFSILRLREGNHFAVQSSPPELCDSSLVGIIEEIDDD